MIDTSAMFSRRELAALMLRVPCSGDEALDEMIREARALDARDRIASSLAEQHGFWKTRDKEVKPLPSMLSDIADSAEIAGRTVTSSYSDEPIGGE